MACHQLGLRALLFTVFDKDEGPTVRCSDPPNAVGRLLKPLGRYLLPETFIKGRVVSMVLDDNVIVGAPVYIEDTLYDRNCFQFNICMVVSSRLDPEPHRDIAQHLAMAFHTLEVEINLLSSPSEVAHVQDILAQLRYQLNTSEECFVRVGSSHAISFKVRRWNPVLPKSPASSSVPVPLMDLQKLVEPISRPEGLQPVLPLGLDPTLMPILPLVDGVRTVQQIVDASPIDEESVLLILRHLLHFRLITMIDEIRLDCRYRLTPEFHTAFENPAVLADVLVYVTGGRWNGRFFAMETEAEVEAVMALYAQIDGWEQTLGQFREAHSEELAEQSISLRHFVTFGLLQGFLERIDSVVGSLDTKEIEELQTLRSTRIPGRKRQLKDKGLTSTQVNQDPGIQEMVNRMKELKAKEMGRGYNSDAACDSAAETGRT